MISMPFWTNRRGAAASLSRQPVAKPYSNTLQEKGLVYRNSVYRNSVAKPCQGEALSRQPVAKPCQSRVRSTSYKQGGR